MTAVHNRRHLTESPEMPKPRANTTFQGLDNYSKKSSSPWNLLEERAMNTAVLTFPNIVAGERWRDFTFPLTHVSLYHLLLDAGAFVLLYT